MEKEFKFVKNTATIIFLAAYTVYGVYAVVTQPTSTYVTILIFGAVLYIFFLGMRPYKYTVGNKELIIHYHLWKNKTINLMECETLTDPISRWADIGTRPHAIELYSNTKKRYCFFPKWRVDFVAAVLKENKRIHCTVKEYTDVHRQMEKKERKERRKAQKEAVKGK